MSTVPVADDQQIYFSTAFGKSAVIALKYAGVKTPEVAWRNNKNAPKMCSPVLHNGLLFYVDDGVMRATGDRDNDGTLDQGEERFESPGRPVIVSYLAGAEGGGWDEVNRKTMAIWPLLNSDTVARVNVSTSGIEVLWD
jgi:hypothetical protein